MPETMKFVLLMDEMIFNFLPVVSERAHRLFTGSCDNEHTFYLWS